MRFAESASTGWRLHNSPRTLFDRYKIHTVSIVYEKISCVRVTPHVYTTIPDLDKLVTAIGEIAAKA